MYKFSKRSRDRLATCHPDIVRVLDLAITRIDFVVICGHRTKEEQELAFFQKTTKVRWPNSKHNSIPSRAVDIIPHPFHPAMWKQKEPWNKLSAVVLQCADELGVKMRWGGHFKSFYDAPHYELI